MFATSIDLLGFLAFVLVFPFTVVDAGDNWYGSNLLESYASVTCLPPFVIHAFLLLAQVLQLHSATIARRATTVRCPHCKHNMQELPRSPLSYSTADDSAQPAAQLITPLTQDSLVDADDDNVTVVNMAPGQETGTCTRTPRESSSSKGAQRQRERAGSSTANETGESEGDRLIEKSE
ncbi:hypothetical protein LTR70_008894 [Exophiala xenobiotica]|uniref:Uncharacterized protein n=1 Tax=Lithohypha guttulata TaxID=1690604 RepID=A0ABR0JZH8_9EURO|nr:hypothetical protein LTR24_008589 [Lithohypha guttulata]KAK5311301.1 hypothetical protein LTR70_008894 [Exophiala xenobiotica]